MNTFYSLKTIKVDIFINLIHFEYFSDTIHIIFQYNIICTKS